jgi:hypothetical protein
MCSYAYKFDLSYALYLIENKNDSDLTIKIVELDKNYGKLLENKASDIINTQNPPNKISESPVYFDCKYCNFLNICHYDEKVEINCRSCKFSKPVENAQWFCSRFNDLIPEGFIKNGCEYHLSINS